MGSKDNNNKKDKKAKKVKQAAAPAGFLGKLGVPPEHGGPAATSPGNGKKDKK